MFLSCEYQSSLTNRNVRNPQKIKIHSFNARHKHRFNRAVIKHFGCFQKNNNMLASEFSTAYLVGLQLLELEG